MDEYIKREDALDAVLFALVGTGHQSIAIYAIKDVPTADVASKREFAKEIFEEIENLFAVENFRLICNRQAFAELKKKYTEAKSDE